MDRVTFQSFLFPSNQELQEESFYLKSGTSDQKEIVNEKLGLREKIQIQTTICTLASVIIGTGFCIHESLNPMFFQNTYPAMWGIAGWMTVAAPTSCMIFGYLAEACTKVNGDIYNNAQYLNRVNIKE